MPYSLPARGSLTFDVIYTPAAASSNDAKVVIECNDADEPRTEVQLTGQGIPDPLQVTPATDFVSQGVPGGPFSPTSNTYILSNTSPAGISWAARNSQNWVVVTPTNGTLAIGQSASVTVALTALANSLPAGQYTDIVTISNFTSGAVQRRGVLLAAQIPPPTLAEALDTPGWTWLTGGTRPWVGQTTNTHDSVDAAQSGTISHSQESWMETTVQGPGMLTFWWAVSSESGYDFLELQTNGVLATRISGTVGWTGVSNHVALGTTALRWRYIKDGSVNAGYDRGWVDQVSFVPDAPAAQITASGTTLLAENCGSGNGAIDPNETVTVNFGLSNAGSLGATNVVATLLPMGGVTSPSGPQSYGTLLPGGSAVSHSFTFTAVGACGDTLAATLQVQYGTNTELVQYAFSLGQSVPVLAENFDGVAAPALPVGWTAFVGGAVTRWSTTTARRDTLPNAVFAPDPNTTSTNTLTSPTFFLPATGGQLSFRHAYSTESCCDGGRLEISIAGAAFTDILTAGGSFVTNGYTTSDGWFGTSANFPSFITTIVNLPASAFGQNVALRWRFTSDSSVSGTGWYVDTVSVSGGYTCCGPPMVVTQPASQAVRPGTNVTFCVTANGSLPISYQWRKDGTNLVNGGRITGATNTCLTLSSVVEGDSGGYSVVLNNFNGSAVSSNATLLVSALDHFAWNPIASPQIGKVPFPVT
ncbi:MAG: immunoglobulin domain-containing protein, partial [Verrucomicrobia bacterium]|nr:immunoglobulin domain-containing protein [Verrucomicrobiota bacterium]